MEMRKRQSRIHIGKFVLTLLLSVCMVVSFDMTRTYAADVVETDNLSELSLKLNRRNPDENATFHMKNLFPGDSETKTYRLSVSYTGTITVSFQVKTTDGDKALSDALQMKVSLADEILYEGSITGMPVLTAELSTEKDAQTDELCYEISVSLRTEAGNECQNKTLTADLNWWANGANVPSTERPTQGESNTTESETETTEGETDTTEGGSGNGGELVDPPDTGDNSLTTIWMVYAGIAAVVIGMTFIGRRRMVAVVSIQSENPDMHVRKKRKIKAWIGMLPMILSLVAFSITSLALVYQKVNVKTNLFETGKVSICLNDNQPVFDEEILFEPGMVIKKDFTIRNDSTCEVYYRLFFSNIEGEFAEVLEASVLDGEAVIFKGKLSELNGIKSDGAKGQLKVNEEHTLTIMFAVPKDGSNKVQGTTVLFDLNAEAVQAVNNPDGAFD